MKPEEGVELACCWAVSGKGGGGIGFVKKEYGVQFVAAAGLPSS